MKNTEGKRYERMGTLFDYLIMSPQGVTVDDMKEHLACTHDRASEAIHDLRMFLGENMETANLTCTPGDLNQRHVYRLVTSLEDHREWVAKRVQDTESRVRTINAILTSVVAGADGRTVEGRRAKVMHKQLSRLIEDLTEIHATE